METTNSNNSNDAFSKNENAAGKTFKATASTLVDAYKKQIDIVSEFYGNMFKTFFDQGGNTWNPVKDYTEMFFNQGNYLSSQKTPFNGFNTNGNSLNAISGTFDKMLKQMRDQNQNLVDTFAKQFEEWNSNVGRLGESYRQVVEKRIDVSKDVVKKLTDAYNKQFEFSLESNKQLLEEINKQADQLYKANQQFWTDISAAGETTAYNENGSKNTDSKNTRKPVKVEAAF